MDKEQVIQLIRKNVSNNFTSYDASEILTNYCIEKGKLVRETNIFISFLLQNPPLLLECLKIALEYFEKKFNITKVWSALDPSNIQGRRRLLHIF